MRMWKVPPRIMCRQHLLGEHNEMHMFIGTIKKGTSIKGYVEKSLVETNNIQKRHDELVYEMSFRGYNHYSPLQYVDQLNLGYVNEIQSLSYLLERCERCTQRYNLWKSYLNL
jgi:hypothetical protein